jgi:outer membrane protein assembly factor BamB
VDNFVIKIDATNGKLVWKYKTDGKIWSAPALNSDHTLLFVTSADSFIYCTVRVSQYRNLHRGCHWTFPRLLA